MTTTAEQDPQDRIERIERICRRHGAVRLAADDLAIARRDELLTVRRHAGAVQDRLKRSWVDGTENLTSAGVVRIRLRRRAKVDLADAAAAASGVAKVVPNTLYSGEPGWDGGPAGPPVPLARGLRPPRRPAPGGRAPLTAVLDTGVAAHAWFDGLPWFAACGADNAEIVDDDLDFHRDRQSGHGTFVAGLVLQRAPAADVRPSRVLTSDGVCDEAALITALAGHRPSRGRVGADVVNLSLGGYTYDDRPSPLIADALRRLGPDVAVVAAAGNHDSARPFWPAAMREVVAVGALDAAGEHRAEFSNHGVWVDACAPGTDVESTFLFFYEPGVAGDEAEKFTGFARWSGTSFAAAQVSGAVAALCARTGRSGREAVRDLLDPTAHRWVRGIGLAVIEPGRGRARST